MHVGSVSGAEPLAHRTIGGTPGDVRAVRSTQRLAGRNFRKCMLCYVEAGISGLEWRCNSPETSQKLQTTIALARALLSARRGPGGAGCGDRGVCRGSMSVAVPQGELHRPAERPPWDRPLRWLGGTTPMGPPRSQAPDRARLPDSFRAGARRGPGRSWPPSSPAPCVDAETSECAGRAAPEPGRPAQRGGSIARPTPRRRAGRPGSRPGSGRGRMARP